VARGDERQGGLGGPFEAPQLTSRIRAHDPASAGPDAPAVTAEFWVTQAFNGISYGALLFLLASGLSLIFGVMRVVNLSHGSYLSHGEQRQLEIALALATPPRVLLLDEPTAGLSPAESRLMADLLKGLDPAITVLMIEHDMDIALEVSQRVTVLHYGRIIADGTRDEVKANPQVREIYLGA
jgi:ABC-type multidrug transport system fused ATPase/permease subunit